MSKVFYDKSIIEQIFEEFRKSNHDLEMISNLVERLPPEDVNTQDNIGNTALILVSFCDYTEIVKLLLQKEGIDVNIQSGNENTALIYASMCGNIEIVKLLLEKEGIDVNIQNNFGYTALTCPFMRNRTEIVKLLENYQKN